MDNRSKLVVPQASIADSPFSGSAKQQKTAVNKTVHSQSAIENNTFGPGASIQQAYVINNTGSSSLKATAQDCRRKLFLTDPAEDRKALKRKKGDRASGTCEWLLETEEFTAWLGRGQATGEAQASNILWLYGNPGTGKSTMAIFLTEELPKKSFIKDGETLIYFFCDSSFDKRKTATSILRGLLLQLIQQHSQLLDYLLHDYNNRGAELFNSFDALWTIFIAAAADQNTGQKYCIIDALDECDLESQEILLQQFQETFLSQDAPSNIRILVTSRPYSKICEYLEEFANKNLASFSQAKQDVDRCIKERVADLAKKKKYTDKVKEQVSDILRERAEGTFLWVGLACEELKDVPSKNAIQVLQTMPKGLYSLFERLLDTALEQDMTEAGIVRHILSLVAVCVRPLSVLELSEACQLYQDEEDINTRIQFTRDQIESCRLIIIEGGKVLLLHQSVKDYLVRAGPSPFINELEAHANIAYRCVNILIEQFYSKEQSHVHFLSYATEEWVNHARMAQSRFEVRDSEAEFFRVNSPSREHWIKTLRSNKRSGLHDIPQQFSILHIAGRWGIDSLVDYIAHQNFQESNTNTMTSVIDFDCVDGRNTTPIQEAVQWGHISVVAKLLCLGAKINGLVEKVASGRSQNNKEMMAFFLDQPEHQVTITENILKAAAGDGSKEVMELLLDRRGDQITITEDIIKAAARNWSNSKEIMELLLDRGGNQITITEGILKTAAGNWSNSKKVMELLLDRRGNQITITEDILKTAAGNWSNGKEIMELLLDRQGDQITITEDILKTAAGDGNKEVIELLLNRRGNQITITEDIIKAAAGSCFGEEVIILLLNQRGDQITITEDVLMAAARNRYGKEVIELLLNQQGDQIMITEDILKATAGTWSNSKEVMELLLNRRGNQITITEDIFEAAAGSPHGEEVIELLLKQHRDHLLNNIKEAVKATVGNGKIGKEVMEILLDLQEDH